MKKEKKTFDIEEITKQLEQGVTDVFDFFESCMQKQILKKYETDKEITFVQQNDYAHKIIHTFLKAKGGETA